MRRSLFHFATSTLVLAALAGLVGCSGSRPALAPPGCDALVLDLRAGTLNGLRPTASMDAVKAQFPCSTGETEEGGPFNFGGGVFFLNHDFYAYTHRDFLEVRTNFAGEVRPAVLNASIADFYDAFGTPDREEDGAMLYDMDYGCLRAEGATGTIVELGIHAQSCAEMEVPR